MKEVKRPGKVAFTVMDGDGGSLENLVRRINDNLSEVLHFFTYLPVFSPFNSYIFFINYENTHIPPPPSNDNTPPPPP